MNNSLTSELPCVPPVSSIRVLGITSNSKQNMKYMLANLGVNLVALACVGVAGYLAVNDKNGWGWFLFIALLCAGSVTFKSDNGK